MPNHWDDRYVASDVPWDTGRVDPHLARAFADLDLVESTAVDLGCGTGTNALWLAAQGLRVTGLDLSPTAVQAAREKALQQSLSAEFRVADLLAGDLGGRWGFAYDRGCFHVMAEAEQRARFAQVVAEHLAPGGLWLSILGSTDGAPRETGPPRRSLQDVARALEPHFELQRVEATHFDADLAVMAWVVLARKR